MVLSLTSVAVVARTHADEKVSGSGRTRIRLELFHQAVLEVEQSILET